MANTDKDILITPNDGQTAEPTIKFTGAGNTPITLRVLDDGTVSFEGSSGQLFSISDGLSGTIFSVNDISGVPAIEVLDNGTVKLAPYGGTLQMGNMGTWTTSGNTINLTNGSGVTKFSFDISLGDFTAQGDIISISDATLKDDIRPIEDALQIVQSLNGVTFHRKNDSSPRRSVGLLAQDVESVLPEAVRQDVRGKAVAYGNLVGLLVEAIKDQQAQIDELRSKVDGI